VLAGVQFLTFGVIAELIMRVYYESQQKKTYNIKQVLRFGDSRISIPREMERV